MAHCHMPSHEDVGMSAIFTMVSKDTDDPANGPNGMGCAQGSIVVDEIPFDTKFHCDCSGTTFIGDNCETPLVESGETPLVESGETPLAESALSETLVSSAITLAAIASFAFLV